MENTKEMQGKEKFDFGAISGSVIIVVLLLVAGWYFYQELEKINADLDDVNKAGITSPQDNRATPDSISDDLSRNPFDAIELELNEIEVEFEVSGETQAEAIN